MSRDGVRVQARGGERQCPLCWDPTRPLGSASCPTCYTRYHRECSNELDGRCATLGCEGRVPTDPAPQDYLARFKGPLRSPHRPSPSRARQLWEEFSLLHAGCGGLFVGGLSVIAFARFRLEPSTLLLLVAGLTVGAALKAGFQQDGFWRMFTGASSIWSHRRWRY